MKKKHLIIIIVLGIIVLIFALILLFSNNFIFNEKNNIEIFDATFSCNEMPEKFYEDNKYIYYFPCVKSNSVYVNLKNGNKMLVVNALEENKVTINDLIKAGLKVYKEEK